MCLLKVLVHTHVAANTVLQWSSLLTSIYHCATITKIKQATKQTRQGFSAIAHLFCLLISRDQYTACYASVTELSSKFNSLYTYSVHMCMTSHLPTFIVFNWFHSHMVGGADWTRLQVVLPRYSHFNEFQRWCVGCEQMQWFSLDPSWMLPLPRWISQDNGSYYPSHTLRHVATSIEIRNFI